KRSLVPVNRSVDGENFLVRRKKITLKPFIEFDDNTLISSEGRLIDYDENRFGEQEDAKESELTEKQLQIYSNMSKDLDASIGENERRTRMEELLFKRLKKVRFLLSQKRSVPPYLIFKNDTLREISEKMPTSRS